MQMRGTQGPWHQHHLRKHAGFPARHGRVSWFTGSIESKEWGARPIRSWSMCSEVTVCSELRAGCAESGLQDRKAYLPVRGDTMIT